MNPERYFRKFSLKGSFAPKISNRKSVKQAPHSEQATGHVMRCREILFTPGCSPRAREFSEIDQLFVRRTAAELRGVKVAQFSDFGLFSTYKTLKKYLPVTSLTAQELHNRMITISPCDSRRSKGIPSGSGVFLRLLVGVLGTPKLAQIFAYSK